ncbi:MAG TPA: DUF4129 domain-containing protein [Candidatus Hydrogenedentes bacterium]|nr:DUF4129 domain-containing protein [Candidatus Hydrogenedentota bacterium]
MCPEPYQPDYRPPEEGGQRTDFQSLKATPDPGFESLLSAAAVAPKAKPPTATDFQSLTGKHLAKAQYRPPRTITDWIIDALTPLMIFIMVYSVIFFLLDVRYVYTEVNDVGLRFVAFCFIMGVVALNRLIARDGSEESMLYMAALAFAIGMYTFTSTRAYEMGSVGRNFMNDNPFLATIFNMAIVIFVWWLVNRLTHECCVDENRTAGDEGILTGAARRFQNRMQRKSEPEPKPTPKRSGDELSFYLEPFDPVEGYVPKTTKEPKRRGVLSDRLPKQHPGISILYFSVPVMFVFAVGLRVVQHGGERMVMAGAFYMGAYIVTTLMLLMLTSLGGLREFFRARMVVMPRGIGVFWITLGLTMIAVVLIVAAQLPRPSLPKIAYVDHHQTDFWSRGSTFQLSQVSATPVELLEQSQFVDRVGKAVLIVLCLFFAYAGIKGLAAFAARAAKQRNRYPRWVIRLMDTIDKTLSRLTRLPALPQRKRRIRIQRDIATSGEYKNSLGWTGSRKKMTPADHIEYAYAALCALAYDLGVPRQPGQTPYEFIDSFPKELDTLREEAMELTRLFVLAAYSPETLGERPLDRVRKFWTTYERVRNRTLA